MSNVRKAVIYCRVSTDEQASNGTSLEGQKQSCEMQASAMGIEIVDVCEDPGVSGKKYENRPGIIKALEHIEAGRANVLITAKLDRIGRSMGVILDIAQRVVKAEAQLIASGVVLDQSAGGKMMLANFSAMAEIEWDNIRERTMGGKQRKADAGAQPSRSKSPYGYHVVNNNDKIAGLYLDAKVGSYQIVEEEARWIKELFAQFDMSGNLSATAKHLSTQGVPTPKGGRQWYARSVADILGNPVYIGKGVYGRRKKGSSAAGGVGRYDPTKKVGDCYFRLADENEWTVIASPPLVDVELWERCQRRLHGNVQDKQSAVGGNPYRKYMLSGLVNCPVCGRKAGYKKPSADHKIGNYSCRLFDCLPLGRPAGYYTNCRQDRMESLTISAMLGLVERQDLLEEAIRAFDEHCLGQVNDSPEQVTERLSQALTKLDIKQSTIARAKIEAMMKHQDTTPYDTMLEEINRDKADLLARLKAAKTNTSKTAKHELKSTMEKLQRVSKAMCKTLTAPDEDVLPHEKQKLLSVLIDHIVPINDGIEIVLRSETLKFIKIAPLVILE